MRTQVRWLATRPARCFRQFDGGGRAIAVLTSERCCGRPYRHRLGGAAPSSPCCHRQCRQASVDGTSALPLPRTERRSCDHAQRNRDNTSLQDSSGVDSFRHPEWPRIRLNSCQISSRQAQLRLTSGGLWSIPAEFGRNRSNPIQHRSNSSNYRPNSAKRSTDFKPTPGRSRLTPAGILSDRPILAQARPELDQERPIRGPKPA